MLKGLNLTVVVTGGIAAYKIPDFVRTLIKGLAIACCLDTVCEAICHTIYLLKS